ncbi:MAG: hypothetical protein GYB26_10145 [Gammaproteobacteria bacterium]|nr:hypothetical protein [Gammaproteobacteria bacterium]
MATNDDNKLKILLERHRPGTVSLAPWLAHQGISRDLQQYYCRSGWLEPVGRGAFRRPGDAVGWRGGLYALQQQAKLAVHVGGITALSMQGAGHYIPLGREKVYLFSPLGVSLPAWFKKHEWDADIEHVRTAFLPQDVAVGEVRRMELASTGGFVPVNVSDTERAILECLYLAPKHVDLVECYQIMEGLVNLRPKIVQRLLEECSSVKVKRLFLYMAEKAGHQWLQFVDRSNINLGAGDRSIVDNGVYIAKHHISISKELASL